MLGILRRTDEVIMFTFKINRRTSIREQRIKLYKT